MNKAWRHCKEKRQLGKASVGRAGGETLNELVPWPCSAERLLRGWVWREPEGQTLSWDCHAVSPWLPNTELFCDMLLTVSSCQIWRNNQKHRFYTLKRKPECSRAQTDPEAALPNTVGCWEVFHKLASPCTRNPLLWSPALIPLTYKTASRTVPLPEKECSLNLPPNGSTL